MAHWIDEYSKSVGWENWEKPILPLAGTNTNTKFKKMDTSLQKKLKFCKREMEQNHIKNGADFVKWMSKKFDPNNEKHRVLAQEMASCLWVSQNISVV